MLLVHWYQSVHLFMSSRISIVIGALCVVALGLIIPSHGVRASVVTLTHTPSSGAASALNDHVFSFTPGVSIPPSGRVRIDFGSGFTKEDAAMDFTDVDVLVNNVQTTLAATANFTAQGVSVADTSLVITVNSTVGVGAGTPIEIRVGTNAIEGATGDRQYRNPSSAGSPTMSLTTYNASLAELDTGSATMSITSTTSSRSLNLPPALPGDISVTSEQGGVRLGWTQPRDADFSHIAIHRNYFPFSGAITSDVFGTVAKGAQEFFDTSVAGGQTYRYIFKSVDTTGHESSSEEYTIAVPTTTIAPTPADTTPIPPPSTTTVIDLQVGIDISKTDTITVDFGGVSVRNDGVCPPVDPERQKEIDEWIKSIDAALESMKRSRATSAGSTDPQGSKVSKDASSQVQSLQQLRSTVSGATNLSQGCVSGGIDQSAPVASALKSAQGVMSQFTGWLTQRSSLSSVRQNSSSVSLALVQQQVGASNRPVQPQVLQRFLNTHGFIVATFGAGSPGNETNAFGPRTRVALSTFQRAYGIVPANGVLSLSTREFISVFDPYDPDDRCDPPYDAQKGGGGVIEHEKFPPKKTYDYKRFGLENINQDPYGSRTCFPTTAAMSFGWLDRQYNTKMVPKKEANLPDPTKSIEELKKNMDWNPEEGSNSAQAVKGIAQFISDHGGADQYVVEYQTEAPRGREFKHHDELEGKTSLNGVDFTMKRRRITGRDVYDEMAKGQDVIISIKGHVLEMYGIDLDDEKGDYDAAWVDPALGKTVGGKITNNGKIEVGGQQTDIQDIIAVSPKKKK